MNAKDLIPVLLKEGAPMMASYLGTPLAGLVVSLIASHYGLPKDSSPAQVQNAIDNSPIHLKSLEYEHREHLASLFSDIVENSYKSSVTGWWIGITSAIAVMALFVYVILDYYKG